MTFLSLSLLGSFTATVNNQPLNQIKSKKAQALLVYLAVERHAVRREFLLELLWPGMPERSARHNLSQALFALRQSLQVDTIEIVQKSTPIILADRHTIQLNPDISIEIDIHQVDQFIEQTQTLKHTSLKDCKTCIELLEQVVRLNRDNFLPDFYLEDSNIFEDWVQAIREDYRRKLIDTLGILTENAIQKHDYPQALAYIDRQLAIDDLDERANCQKIEVLALADRRVEAMRHYHEFSRRLEDQLGTIPNQGTTMLYEEIRSGDLPIIFPKPGPTPHNTDHTIPTIPRHNLPPQPTPFIGRKNELHRLDQMLQNRNIHLISIVAQGGMGKTRLAIACAEQQVDHKYGSEIHLFSDGVFFIPLAQLNEADRIVDTIAKAINLQIESETSVTQSPKAQLLHYLQRQRMLLVADNFEHLIPYTSLLAEILQSAPDVKLLVTSQERLNLRAEHVFSISGLPFSDQSDALETVTMFPAAQLFIQSAQRFQPNFQINSEDELASLALICQLIGGMPLALELASSWTDLLSLKEIAAEIQRSLDFLETELQDVPDRHRGIRAIFDFSWERLNQDEKEVFPRFSIFKGGCTRKAAQAVTNASLRTLSSLVKKSLIQVQKTNGRYLIHELLRQYTAKKLSEDAKTDYTINHSHCTYFCNALKIWGKNLQSSSYLTALNEVSLDYENILKAWEWANENNEISLLLKAIFGLAEYLYAQSQEHEIQRIFNRSIQRLQANHGVTPLSADVTRLLILLLALQPNYFYSSFGGVPDEDAEDRLNKCLFLLSSPALSTEDTHQEQALVHKNLGIALQSNGPNAEGMRHLEKSLQLYRKLNDPVAISDTLRWFAFFSRSGDLYGQFENYFSECMALAQKVGEPRRLAQLHSLLGDYYRYYLFAYEDSLKSYKLSFDMSKESGIINGMLFALNRIGWLSWFLGAFDQSLETYKKALELSHTAGYQYLTNVYNINICLTQAYRGQFSKAETLLRQSLKMDPRVNLTDTKQIFAFIQIHRGLYDSGQILAEERLNAWNLRLLSWIALAKGEFSAAYAFACKSVEECASIPNISKECDAWSRASLGLAFWGMNQDDDAKNVLYMALDRSVKIRAFLPLMHLMPIVPVVLSASDEEILQIRALELYAMAKILPFVANSKLFEDIAEKSLHQSTAQLPQEVILAAQSRGQLLDFWKTAEELLDELRELGWAYSVD